MTEKRKIQRFNLDEGRIWEAIEGLSPFKTTYTLEEVCEKLNEQQAEIDDLKEENEQLDKENKKLQEEIEELKRERDSWKSSTCSYMNKDSLLRLLVCIATSSRGWTEEEHNFMRRLEKELFDDE